MGLCVGVGGGEGGGGLKYLLAIPFQNQSGTKTAHQDQSITLSSFSVNRIEKQSKELKTEENTF